MTGSELRDEVIRLSGLAHAEVSKDPATSSATHLFRDAAVAAEHGIPGPLGAAIAGVLTEAAYERQLKGLNGTLGASITTVALATAVLHNSDEEPPQ